MTTEANKKNISSSSEQEFCTFYVDNLLIGINIQQLQEINRHLDTTSVPHAPDFVRGVVNLRGEVVTVLDLRIILGMQSVEITDSCRNVIVNIDGEKNGLLVDKISDVVYANADEIESPPANISGVDGRFFKGVYKLESDLMVILDIAEVISNDTAEVAG